MIQPYYASAGITIYHGDCRDVLPTLPPDSVHLLLTDPPYGVRWRSNHRQDRFDEIVGDDSQEAAVGGVTLCLPVLTRKRHLYIFGRYDFGDLPISKPLELIWDKGVMSGGDISQPWGLQHEYIQFTTNLRSCADRDRGNGNVPARLRRGSILAYLRVNGAAIEDHPSEKPVDLLRELIESSSFRGEAVLDPFMGSGSTLEAALWEGRQGVGIEIDEAHCETAARRCERLSRQLAQLCMTLEVA